VKRCRTRTPDNSVFNEIELRWGIRKWTDRFQTKPKHANTLKESFKKLDRLEDDMKEGERPVLY